MGVRTFAITLVNFFIAVVEGFLGLRFILKLFGANANAGFVQWVYDMSSELLAPFRGIFPTRVIDNEYVIEFSTLFAMLVYALIGLLALAIIAAVTPDADREVVVTRGRRNNR